MLANYIGNVDEFPILSQWDYFNHAGTSPWPSVTRRAVRAFVDEWGTELYMKRNWFKEVEALKGTLQRLINAEREDEIALMKNTADGICAISTGIAWRRGDRVVVPTAEYPSNMYPWMDVAERHGVELIQVPERTLPDGTVRVDEADIVELADHPRTRLIALSHVEWASGQRIDVERIGTWCRSRGVLFAVDAIQSLGVVPVDVQRMKIDFLFSGGHKWLMSPPGSGLLYCRHDLTAGVVSPLVGTSSVTAKNFETVYERRPDAGRFETGTPAMASLIGMRPSVDLLVELGLDAIHEQVRLLGDRFTDGARAKGYTVVSSRQAGVTSGSVCFTSPTHKPGAIVHELKEKHRIELATRIGRVRFAPHFYNTMEQVERLIAALPAH